MKYLLKLSIVLIFLSGFLIGKAEEKQGLPAIDPNLCILPSYFERALMCRNTDQLKPLATYADGKTMLVRYRELYYNFRYCLLVGRENHRAFFGFVDFTDENKPRLMFGTIINLADQQAGTPPKKILVRFDMDIDLQTYLAPPPLSGRYNFCEILKWRVKDPVVTEQNRYKINTAYGIVSETSGGFYAEKLTCLDYLTFNAGGTGKAQQVCTADGREEYMSSYDKTGPRGGYHGTVDEPGVVTYDVTITRTQPMKWSLTDDPSLKQGKLLKLTYSPSMTSSIKYGHATAHPVMSQIKGAYSRWTKAAPVRFIGTDEYIYVTTLADWLVLRPNNSDWMEASKYMFVPRAGFKIKVQSQWDPSQMVEVDVVPQQLIMDMVNEVIK